MPVNLVSFLKKGKMNTDIINHSRKEFSMMNVIVTSQNFTVTPKIEKVVRLKIVKRLDKLLQNFDDSLKTFRIRIEKDKFDNYQLSCELTLPKKETIYCESKHIKFLSALTDLQQKAEKQIKRYKDSITPYSLG